MEFIREDCIYARQSVAAAKLANADTFIRQLPDGYNTVLTGDGANLSQGQRQLLSIARAAVADPPVLILDEATSSIDTRTEKIVQVILARELESQPSLLVMAHQSRCHYQQADQKHQRQVSGKPCLL